jgi:hypothetical protein
MDRLEVKLVATLHEALGEQAAVHQAAAGLAQQQLVAAEPAAAPLTEAVSMLALLSVLQQLGRSPISLWNFYNPLCQRTACDT